MAQYVWKCENGHVFVQKSPMAIGPVVPGAGCLECGAPMRHDYLAENAGIDRTSLTPDHVDRVRKHQALFLPGAKDFAGPDDPDGIVGLKEWQDTHQPRPSNKKPAWPTDSLGGARTSF
jgi:hypothetical protein